MKLILSNSEIGLKKNDFYMGGITKETEKDIV